MSTVHFCKFWNYFQNMGTKFEPFQNMGTKFESFQNMGERGY